jgi:hypothetical protein
VAFLLWLVVSRAVNRADFRPSWTRLACNKTMAAITMYLKRQWFRSAKMPQPQRKPITGPIRIGKTMKDYKKKMMVFLPAVDERQDETNKQSTALQNDLSMESAGVADLLATTCGWAYFMDYGGQLVGVVVGR